MRNFFGIVFLILMITGCSNNNDEYVSNKNVSQIKPGDHKMWAYPRRQGDTVYFDFGEGNFTVDSINLVEDIIFIHTSTSDSSYFNIHAIEPWIRHQRLADDSTNTILRTIKSQNFTDYKGINDDTNLYWREMSFSDFEVTYNKCPEDKLAQYDKIMDAVIAQVKTNAKHTQATNDGK